MPKHAAHARIHSEVISALRMRREAIGMSMTLLAQKAGLSLSMISFVERELRKPTLETLLRIAAALETDLGGLIKRATENAESTDKL